MDILIEIINEPFLIHFKQNELIAHHIGTGRDYQFCDFLPMHPELVKRTLQKMIVNGLIPADHPVLKPFMLKIAA